MDLDVEGSNPSTHPKVLVGLCARSSVRIERQPPELKVPRSNRGGRTIFPKHLAGDGGGRSGLSLLYRSLFRACKRRRWEGRKAWQGEMILNCLLRSPLGAMN